MNDMLKRNPSFQLYGEVTNICNSFEPFSELQYFGFCRIYRNGEFLNLTTDHQWPEDYFIQQNNLPATATNFNEFLS